MKNNFSSKSGLFLMELIISIFFFALAGAICVRLFVSSHIISRKSVELNYAVEWSQNIAETFYGCNGSVSEMAALFENARITDKDNTEKFFLFFDKNFVPFSDETKSIEELSSSPACTYMISVQIDQKGDLLTCTVCTSRLPAESIYELELELFPKKEASDGN